MQDETLSQPLPLPRPRRSLAPMLLIAVLAFALGGGLVGWLIHTGQLPFDLPGHEAATTPARTGPAGLTGNAVTAARTVQPLAGNDLSSLGSVEARLALIEDRLARINVEATAASGNAARSEALLIAYAARRRIDKGEPLGFVAEQLKLRFGGAQPEAVETVIAAAKAPITLDELSGQLEAAAPILSGVVPNESTWTRVRREITSLFVVRRAPVPSATPASRIVRARLMLARGQIDEAVTEVERLPGSDHAQDWIDTARRYEATQRALDVIETSAMLEPRTLRDAEGRAVEQPSPLASPAPAAQSAPLSAPAPVASASTAP